MWTGTSGTNVNLTNVVGEFVAGETLIASDSIETGKLIETSGNADITISSIKQLIRLVMPDQYLWMMTIAGQDFSADFVTEAVRSGLQADCTLEEE